MLLQKIIKVFQIHIHEHWAASVAGRFIIVIIILLIAGSARLFLVTSVALLRFSDKFIYLI